MKKTLANKILELLATTQGLSDREITDILLGKDQPQQKVNPVCRRLAERGEVVRRTREDGIIGNYLPKDAPVSASHEATEVKLKMDEPLTEDAVKRFLVNYLKSNGWTTKVAWGRAKGVDIRAKKNDAIWLIEVKGTGSYPQMRVNFFLNAIGEIIQRMEDSKFKYSLAFPDLPQYRNLWNRVPTHAKRKLELSVLFVSEDGEIEELAFLG